MGTVWKLCNRCPFSAELVQNARFLYKRLLEKPWTNIIFPDRVNFKKIRLGFFKNLFSICFLNLWKPFYKLFYTFIKWNLLNKFVAGFLLIYEWIFVCKIQFTLRFCLKVSQSSRFDFIAQMIIVPVFKINMILFI